MNSVSLFVKSIIVITFMWCMAEYIMPESSMKKYSTFIYGMIIISLTVSVFTKVEFTEFFSSVELNDLSEYNHNYLKNLYEEKLENILREKYDNESITAELTEDYKLKNIHCDDDKIYDEIMRDLNE